MTARLWAPYASSVEIEVEGRPPQPLVGNEGGWWAHPGPVRGRYRFVVDGRAIPDPRSMCQPQGLEGPSEELGPFPWTDTEWTGFALEDAILYELHIGTFTPEGTFDAAIGRLGHLVDLGVNAVELMPVHTFPGHHGWGYDGALLFAPHWAYGGPDGMRRFVDACHARGLAVVLDVVYDHLGPTGNHLGMLGPFFTDAHRTPWGPAVNLDQPGSNEVRHFFIDNALMWIERFHVDGLRLDAVQALVDRSDTHFLRQLRGEVQIVREQTERAIWLIAESDLNDPTITDPPGRGMGMDAVWSGDFHHALHVALTGEHDGWYVDYDGWLDAARALNRVYAYDGRVSLHRGREHGTPAGDRPRRRFVAYSQTHDQVGNRARGERLGHLCGQRGIEAAAACVLLSPFVPLLFQGEEWMASTPFLYFTDHRDPTVAAAVSDGRRREFASFTGFAAEHVPDPQDTSTFERSRLDWTELDRPPHATVLAWYRNLIALRRSHPALASDGPLDTVAAFDDATGAFVMVRGGQVAVVVATATPADLGLAVAVALPGATVRSVITTNDVALRGPTGTLAPMCTAVVEITPPPVD